MIGDLSSSQPTHSSTYYYCVDVLLVLQVQSLAEASLGGDERVEALQKELLAVREVSLPQANTLFSTGMHLSLIHI